MFTIELAGLLDDIDMSPKLSLEPTRFCESARSLARSSDSIHSSTVYLLLLPPPPSPSAADDDLSLDLSFDDDFSEDLGSSKV